MTSARILSISGLLAVLALALAGSVLYMPEVWGGDGRTSSGRTLHFGPPPALPASLALVSQNQPEMSATEARAINARIPFAKVPFTAARPFVFLGDQQDRARALTCLSAAMLYEAGLDADGQRSVAQVVLNRVRHPAFPASICEVVAQGISRQTGCQFTFTCDGSLTRRYSAPAIAEARKRAERMLDGEVYGAVGLATHYHTDWVHPYWSDDLDKIARVGDHLFFKWRGYWGTRPAFGRKPSGRELYVPAFVNMESPGEKDQVPAIDPEPIVQPAVLISAPPPAIPAAPAAPRLTLQHTAIQGPATGVAPEAESRNLVISPAALDGNRLRYTDAKKGVFYLELKAGTGSGQFRRVAERLCGGRASCHVLGWDSGQEVPTGPGVTGADRRNVRFEFQPVPRQQSDFCRNPPPGLIVENC